jgi:uncharacterized repeat protein (TIGR03803 family)
MKKITLLLVALLWLGIGAGRAQYTDLVNFDDTLAPKGEGSWGSLVSSGNTLYGTAGLGGAHSQGVIFSVHTDGTGYTDLIDFNNLNAPLGAQPYGSLILSGDTLYGMTDQGGVGAGVIFAVQTNGTGYSDLVNFNRVNGGNPIGSLILSRDTLYGMTEIGGTHGDGIIFSVQTNGAGFSDLVDFDDTVAPMGLYPAGSLILSGSTLYGMARFGGIYGYGVIFKVQTNGTGYTDLLNFNDTITPKGANPQGSLILSGNTLYGMTFDGGANEDGVIFSLKTDGTGYTDLVDFNDTMAPMGSGPFGSLILSGTTLYGLTTGGGSHGSGVIFSVQTNGTEYIDLLDFNDTIAPMGTAPSGNLLLSGNTLYGATIGGGSHNHGVVFSFNLCNLTAFISSSVGCSGITSSSATATPSGGTSPYTYSWNNGQTNATATGLSSGTYSVSVTDSSGCTGAASVTITQPPLLQDSINSSCATCCNCKGTTHVYVWGGTPPYTYSWSDGRTNDTLMSLASGSYTATITDSNGCIITDTVFVSHGDHVSVSQTNVLCNGESDGTASVSVDGSFSYSWSPGGETTASVSGLSAGTYSVTLTNVDTTGCSSTYSFNITQPAPLVLTYGAVGYNTSDECVDTNCLSVEFMATGGTPPYTYSDLFPTGPICNSTPVTGTVTDVNGCSYSIPSGVGLGFGLSIRVQINNNASCNGVSNGSATVNLRTGGLGISTIYSWSPGGGTNQTENNLSAGTYTVTVVNNTGPVCPVLAVIAITQPPPLILTADSINATTGNCDGSAWANVSGGTAPYTYSWTGGLITDTINNQCAGYYCCTITDAGGCIDSVCTNIETTTGTGEVKGESEKVKVYPNPNVGVFTMELSVASNRCSVEVYNVLGENVYNTSLPQTPKGALSEIDLTTQPDGVYFYRVLNIDGGLIGDGKLIIQK